MLTLELPYPPSINSYYGTNKFGSKYIKEKGRAYRNTVVNSLSEYNLQTLSSSLSVEISVFPPDLRKRDLDNILKCLLDSLTHSGVYVDDSLIDILIVKRMHKVKDGLCIVTITELL